MKNFILNVIKTQLEKVGSITQLGTKQLKYTNARQIYNTAKSTAADSALLQVCVEFSGLIETQVKEFAFEVGTSALDCEVVTAEEYLEEISTAKICPELFNKELAEIELLNNAIYFYVVDFPPGKFKKAASRIFAIIKNLGYDKIIINDTNRTGQDIWSSYGFSGAYLDNVRIKIL